MRYTRRKKGGGEDPLFAPAPPANYVPIGPTENIEGLDKNSIRKSVSKGELTTESVKDSAERLFVFLFYKLNKIPLTDEDIQSSYTQPYSKFLLHLTTNQRSILRNAVSQGPKDITELSTSVFNTSLDQLNTQIQQWEKPNTFIYQGKNRIVAFTSAGSLARIISILLKSDREQEYIYDSEKYICNPNTEKTCIGIYNNFESYERMMEVLDKNSQYIVITNPHIGSLMHVNSSDFHTISFIQDAFKNGSVHLVSPTLAFYLQKQHKDLWNQSYPDLWDTNFWNPPRSFFSSEEANDLHRMTLLTLQKYAIVRRWIGTHDPNWCSNVYKTCPSGVLMSFELKQPFIEIPGYRFDTNEFIAELYKNKAFVKPDILKNISANNLEKGIVLKHNRFGFGSRINDRASRSFSMILKSLDTLLPTPKGFNPMFPWQLFGQTSSKRTVTRKKRSNILRNIAKRKPNTTASSQAESWNTYNRILGPQYVTAQEMVDYSRQYSVPGLYIPAGPKPGQKPAGPKPEQKPAGPRLQQVSSIPFNTRPAGPKPL